MKKTSFRVLFWSIIFNMCFLTQGCVGLVHYNEMKLQTKINNPTILNLRNYGNTNIAFFRQAENLVKGHLTKNSDKEYGYYIIKYKAERVDNYLTLLAINGAFAFTTALFGVPTYSTDFNLTAYLYIFNSQGDLVREYIRHSSTSQLAGLYYGYKPTKKIEREYCEIYEEMFEEVLQEAEDINNILLKSGAIDDENTKKAKDNMEEFLAKKE